MIAEEIKATVEDKRMNQVPPTTPLKAEKSSLVGIIEAIKKIKHVNKLTNTANIDILVEALGPKCLVTISMHKKDSQLTKIPPPIAKKSF